MHPFSPTRRQFLRTASAAALATPFLQIPGSAQGRTVRHASVGSAGMAFSDLSSFSKHPAFELVAVADVDLCRTSRVLERFPKVRIYQDWREMLAKEDRNIDSVNVSTPDHMHAIAAMEAMRRGKHVYVQKPLAQNLGETRLLTEFARRQGVVSQMGIQVSSSIPQRYGEWLVRSGVIGKIKEVHTFSDKSWGDDDPLPEGEDQVPPTLDWNQWLGVAETRPFKRDVYHPGQWRRRVDFGTGTLGDMGCHIYSPPYRALELTWPTRVTSHGPEPGDVSWGTSAKVHLVYPGTQYTADSQVDVWWYDGGELPPEALREPIGERLPDQGSIFVGTDGMIVLPHGPEAFVLPEAKAASLQRPEIPERNHYAEFLDAVLAGGKVRCSTDFAYAGPLTESVLIGNVAARFRGEPLDFDGRALRFTSRPQANEYLTREYRDGWEIEELGRTE